jgi:hypothetical protein
VAGNKFEVKFQFENLNHLNEEMINQWKALLEIQSFGVCSQSTSRA